MNGCFVKLDYNSERDSFILLCKYPNENWDVVVECKCVRQENAHEDEEAEYVHFYILRSLEYLIHNGFTLLG